MARCRMIVLYDRSARDGSLVLGTGNRTEGLLGYTTMYGDNACALNPMGQLYKTEIRLLAGLARIARGRADQGPSADLWEGQADEDELGFTYAEADRSAAPHGGRGSGPAAAGGPGLRAGPGAPGRAPGAGHGLQARACRRWPSSRGAAIRTPTYRPGADGPTPTGAFIDPASRCPRSSFPAALCHFVATPIGNLGDIGLRALAVLAAADVVYAEDTRHTRRLLDRYGLRGAAGQLPRPQQGPGGAAHRRAAAGRAQKVAVVSDAGMPCISDPGLHPGAGPAGGGSALDGDSRALEHAGGPGAVGLFA